MKLKNIATAMALAAMTTAASAQSLNSAYFTGDYKFRHTMNPAFDNEQNYVAIPALGNINIAAHGNFGYQDVVFNNPMFMNGSDKRLTTFMNPYISADEALDGFSSGSNRITGNVGITILSAGFKAFGGYNTVEINSRTSFGISLPYELFEFAKNTGNRYYDIGDISARAESFAELAFGHSRQLTEKLRVGAKLKLLFGLGRADFRFEDVRADLTGDGQWEMSGKAQADVSIKGFKYLSATDDYNIPENGQYEHVDDIDLDGFGLGGFGMAVDLGATYRINDDWTVSAALLDLGFISWSSNLQAVNRSEKFIFGGFHDIAVNGGSGTEIEDQADNYGDQITDFVNLKDNGDQGGRTTALSATINAGCEYTLPVYRKMTFGFLSSTRLAGDFTWTEGRLSANWTPLSWIDGGMSFAVNSFTASMGWVVNIHPKGYNFFIGMDHLLGKMSKEAIPLSSNASVNLGMSVTF